MCLDARTISSVPCMEIKLPKGGCVLLEASYDHRYQWFLSLERVTSRTARNLTFFSCDDTDNRQTILREYIAFL
jgi:hypothetical protein